MAAAPLGDRIKARSSQDRAVGLFAVFLRSSWVWLCIVLAVLTITIGSLAPNMGPPPTFGFDKIIHASAYGGLALLLACRLPPWLAVCMAAGLGGGLEIAQGSIPGRLGSWGDFAANGTGALVGVFVRVLLQKLMRRS
ncbi:hypothetical protein F11_15915 [Rhodospirillum rubrum F11]|nr:hypothetical protein F11_15915 [Rhodospirillum rubrum F11]